MIVEYQYKEFRIKTMKSGNGTQLDIVYDAMRMVTEYHNSNPSAGAIQLEGNIADFGYGYNKEGMRTYENYQPGGGETNQQWRAKVFTYDSLYQITGVKYDVPNPIAELQNPGSQTYSKQVSYAFDNSGNRENLTTTLSGQTPVAQTYQTNTLNQYTSIDSGIFGYDNVGNTTSGVIYLDDPVVPGTRYPVLATFVYDYQNELVRVEQQADSAVLGEYAYDALGRRIWKNARNPVTPQPQNTQTYFWYNGAECIEETDNTGNTIATYTFGIAIDEAINVEYPVASQQYPNYGTYWYHTDALGSVTAVTDSEGIVIERYKYDIYGEATVLEPDGQTIRAEFMIGNRILYTGREYDKETGLYYYRARYYHPQIGRFVSADPKGTDRIGNLFAYVNNSSLNWTDPLGKEMSDAERVLYDKFSFELTEDVGNPDNTPDNELTFAMWLKWSGINLGPFTSLLIGVDVYTDKEKENGEDNGDRGELWGFEFGSDYPVSENLTLNVNVGAKLATGYEFVQDAQNEIHEDLGLGESLDLDLYPTKNVYLGGSIGGSYSISDDVCLHGDLTYYSGLYAKAQIFGTFKISIFDLTLGYQKIELDEHGFYNDLFENQMSSGVFYGIGAKTKDLTCPITFIPWFGDFFYSKINWLLPDYVEFSYGDQGFDRNFIHGE